MFEPCVWLKIAVTGGRNLHIFNNLSLHVKDDINKNTTIF
jgi:hypothetical protein